MQKYKYISVEDKKLDYTPNLENYEHWYKNFDLKKP
jgi:hypothetical protein